MNNNIPIEFVDNPSDKNTNNHKEYYPFVFRNDVWNVDIKWFSNAHPEIQNLFHNKNLIDFQFPHPSVSKEDDIKCKKIYWKHSEIYNYDFWYREDHKCLYHNILYNIFYLFYVYII